MYHTKSHVGNQHRAHSGFADQYGKNYFKDQEPQSFYREHGHADKTFCRDGVQSDKYRENGYRENGSADKHIYYNHAEKGSWRGRGHYHNNGEHHRWGHRYDKDGHGDGVDGGRGEHHRPSTGFGIHFHPDHTFHGDMYGKGAPIRKTMPYHGQPFHNHSNSSIHNGPSRASSSPTTTEQPSFTPIDNDLMEKIKKEKKEAMSHTHSTKEVSTTAVRDTTAITMETVYRRHQDYQNRILDIQFQQPTLPIKAQVPPEYDLKNIHTLYRFDPVLNEFIFDEPPIDGQMDPIGYKFWNKPDNSQITYTQWKALVSQKYSEK